MDKLEEKVDAILTTILTEDVAGNWKGISSRFKNALSNWNEVKRLVGNDRKWQKRVDQVHKLMEKLADDMDKEFG